MTNDSEDWKEKKFQEKIVQLLDLVKIDFYQNIFENAEGKGLPDVKDEKFIKIRAEYPTSFGDVGLDRIFMLKPIKGNVLFLN